MKRISPWLLLLGLAACNGGSDDKVVLDLQKRVTQLEKKVKSLEAVAKGRGAKPGAEKGKTSAEKGKASAEKGKSSDKGAADKGGKSTDSANLATVKAEGDAAKVVLSQGKKKFKIPGKVPPGSYTVLASFDAAKAPEEAGKIEVKAKKSLTLSCSEADATCRVAGG